MINYVGSRCLQAIVVIIGVTLAVFVVSRSTGDPTNLLLPLDASAAQKQTYAAKWGLDQPLSAQYWTWVVNTLEGDLGTSFGSRVPVGGLIASRLGNSVVLALASLAIAAFVGTACGVVAALFRGQWADVAMRALAILGQSLPAFWLALILQYFLAIRFPLFPVGGALGFASLILPAFTLGWFISASVMRLVRSSMIAALDSDYVLLARSKGASTYAVVIKHALRNAVIAPVTFLGVYLGVLVGSAVVVEAVFFWPGVGSLAYQAVLQRDFPLLQGVILVVTCIVVMSSLVIDLAYVWLDPRIRG